MLNVGTLDRILRAIAGLVLIVTPLLTTATWFANPVAFWAAIIVGVVLLATALFSFCPIYAALGIRTRPRT